MPGRAPGARAREADEDITVSGNGLALAVSKTAVSTLDMLWARIAAQRPGLPRASCSVLAVGDVEVEVDDENFARQLWQPATTALRVVLREVDPAIAASVDADTLDSAENRTPV